MFDSTQKIVRDRTREKENFYNMNMNLSYTNK